MSFSRYDKHGASLKHVIDHSANYNYVAIKNLPTLFSQLQVAWISFPELYLEKDSKSVVMYFIAAAVGGKFFASTYFELLATFSWKHE